MKKLISLHPCSRKFHLLFLSLALVTVNHGVSCAAGVAKAAAPSQKTAGIRGGQADTNKDSLEEALLQVQDPFEPSQAVQSKNQSPFVLALQSLENAIVSSNQEAAVQSGAPGAPASTPANLQTQKEKESWLYREWKRVDLPVDIPLNVLPSKSFDFGAIRFTGKYEQRIRPSGFESEVQDRRDILRMRLDANYEKLGGSAEAEFIWSRIFQVGEKWKIYKVPRPSRIPVNAQKALLMDPGEVVRLRLTFGLGLNESENLTDVSDEFTTPLRGGLGVSQQIFADVYRLAGTRVEVRIATIGTPLQPTATFSIENFNPVSLTVNMGVEFISRLFNRQLTRILRVEPLTAGVSKTLSESLRTDTRMAAYDLDLATEEGAESYKKIFRAATLVEILKEIIRIEGRSNLGERLREQATDLDKSHLKYLGLPDVERPVIRRIQGSIISDTTNKFFRSNWAGRLFFRYSKNRFDADSEVYIYDEQDRMQAYRFVAGQREMEWRAALSLRGDNDRRSIFGLFEAKNMPTGPRKDIKLVPQRLTDVIFRQEFAAKKMDSDQVQYFREHFRSLHPTWGYLVPWEHFQGDGDKDLGTVTYDYNFHTDALTDLPKIPAELIHDRLRQLLDAYPNRDMLLTTLNQAEKPTQGNSLNVSLYADEKKPVVPNVYSLNFENIEKRLRYDHFENDIRFISLHLSKLLENPDPNIRYQLLGDLMTNNLFFTLGPALWLSFLPQYQLEKYLKFTIYSSHDRALKVPPFKFGDEPNSALYLNIQSQMTYLQSREFDNLLRQKALLDSRGLASGIVKPNRLPGL